MNAVRHVALAHYLERVRDPSFLALLGLAVLLAYGVTTEAIVLRVHDVRGLYDAAWIGLLMATTLAVFMSLAGFYLVRGRVPRDRATGVGEVIAATPLRGTAYVAGAFASNVAVLLALVAVLAVAAVLMLLVHGEDRTLDLYELLMPFLVVTVPIAGLTAAMAVLFDCVPSLRNGIGNVTYFFAWAVMAGFAGSSLFGLDAVVHAARPALEAAGLPLTGGIALGVGTVDLPTIAWPELDWSASMRSRLAYVAAALGIAGLAALPFDRFDPARDVSRRGRRRRPASPSTRPSGERGEAEAAHPAPSAPVHADDQPRSTSAADLVPAARASAIAVYARLTIAEATLLLRARPVAWYAVAAGFALACALAPVDITQRWLLPLAWLWPLLLWSELGAREAAHRTHELVRSAPSPATLQVAAAWSAGVLLALVTGSGAILRAFVEPQLALGLAAGAVFVPALALFLGQSTGSTRAFQAVYMTLWYVGPLNGVAPLDPMGATAAAQAGAVSWGYVCVTVVLLAATVIVRRLRTRPPLFRPRGAAPRLLGDAASIGKEST